MPRKQIKLTERLREKIKRDYTSLRLRDFDGEALIYLKKVRGAAKGRKAQSERVAKIGELVIPKDSELYRMIERGAELKSMTVAKFIKKYKEELLELAQHGDFIANRETEYLIDDISKIKEDFKVLVNDGNGYLVTPKLEDVFNIQQFTQHILSYSNIFLIVYRVHYKTTGDISHYLPPPAEYQGLEEEEEIEAMLDSYYPEITYLKSVKKRDAPQEKIIEPDAKERKGAKSKSQRRSKRKGVSKNTKKK